MKIIRHESRIRYLVIMFVMPLLALAPVYSAFAEIQATPIIEPTPTPAVVPVTPETTETPDVPVGTPEATDIGVSTERSVNTVGTNSITESDYLSNCEFSSDTITRDGTPVSVTCDYGLGLALGSGRIYRPNLPYGFEAEIQFSNILGEVSTIPLDWGNRQGYAAVTISVGLLYPVKVHINIRASENAVPNSTFQTQFGECMSILGIGCSPDWNGLAISLSVAPQDIIEDFNLYCDEPDPLTITIGQQSSVKCTIETTEGYETNHLQMTTLQSSLQTASGWRVEYYHLNGQSLDINEIQLSELGEFSFLVTLTAVGCDASGISQAFELTVGMVLMLGDVPLSDESFKTVNGPQMNVDSSVVLANAEVTVLPAIVPAPYSLESHTPEVEPELRIRYSVQGCGAWSTSMQISAFEKEGDTSHSDPVPRVTGITNLDTEQQMRPQEAPEVITLAQGTDSAGGEDHTHTFKLEYTIPANTPVGKYKSTIVVTVTSDSP